MQQLSGVFLALLMLGSLPVQAKMYKWVDEEGRTHFGDSIPEQYLVKEHKELNEQGATLKRIDAAPTKEEKAEEARLAEVKKEEDKLIEEQRKRDRVLLDTYTTERDLIAARDARINAVDLQLQLSESIIVDGERKLKETQDQITGIKGRGKVVPENISNKVIKEEKQLASHKSIAEGLRERKTKVAEQFNGYIMRFRELKAAGIKVKEDRRVQK